MKSIPTIFKWDNTVRAIINSENRLTKWVFEGKGIATRKWDGVAIKVENGKVFRRHEWRSGEAIPAGFIRLEAPDPKKPNKTIPGWVPIVDSFKTKPQGADERALKEAWEDKLKQLTQSLWMRLDAADEAKRRAGKGPSGINPYAPQQDKRPWVTVVPNGTYELCGPKIRGNHERLSGHVLYEHGGQIVRDVPRTFDKLKAFLEKFDGEGIVWHCQIPGGELQLAKVKRRDFGFYTRVSKEDLAMAYREEKPSVPNSNSVDTSGSGASSEATA